jgi:electron transport complex protein RnfD
MVVLGTAFAVIIAKQLYGGLGHNPFNPAMIGYVVLLISFPVQMTSWLPPHEIAANSRLQRRAADDFHRPYGAVET